MPTDTEIPSVILTHSSDNWEHDPLNPRRWPTARKWQAMTIVCIFPPVICIMAYGIQHPKVSSYTFIATLGSSMMAPAAPEIVEKYGMTHSTDLSSSVRPIYTLTARYYKIYNFGDDPLDFLSLICPWTAFCWTPVRNVWPHMGKLVYQMICLSIADANANLRSCTPVTCCMQFLT